MQRDLNIAVAEFTELKQQLEKDTLVLSVLKKLQEVRRGANNPAPQCETLFWALVWVCLQLQ